MRKQGTEMKSKSDDNLVKALSLLKQGARSKQGAGVSEEIGELFLAHLRVRRKELREWIEVLRREAGAGAAGQPDYAYRERRVSRNGQRGAAAWRTMNSKPPRAARRIVGPRGAGRPQCDQFEA